MQSHMKSVVLSVMLALLLVLCVYAIHSGVKISHLANRKQVGVALLDIYLQNKTSMLCSINVSAYCKGKLYVNGEDRYVEVRPDELLRIYVEYECPYTLCLNQTYIFGVLVVRGSCESMPMNEIYPPAGRCTHIFTVRNPTGRVSYVCYLVRPGHYCFKLWTGYPVHVIDQVDVYVREKSATVRRGIYTVVIESGAVQPNTTFTVKIYAKPGENITGAVIKFMIWDTNIIDIVGIKSGDLGKSIVLRYRTYNTCRPAGNRTYCTFSKECTLYVASEHTCNKHNCILATLKLTARNTGLTYITLDCDESEIRDQSGNLYRPYKCINARIIVTQIPCDLDGDYKLDLDDVILCMKIAAGIKKYVTYCDLNDNDRYCDIGDCVLVLRSLTVSVPRK